MAVSSNYTTACALRRYYKCKSERLNGADVKSVLLTRRQRWHRFRGADWFERETRWVHWFSFFVDFFFHCICCMWQHLFEAIKKMMRNGDNKLFDVIRICCHSSRHNVRLWPLQEGGWTAGCHYWQTEECCQVRQGWWAADTAVSSHATVEAGRLQELEAICVNNSWQAYGRKNKHIFADIAN